MDRLAERNGNPGPWPVIDSIAIGAMARAMGCDAVRVEEHADLLERLETELGSLAARETPLVLEVAVAPDPTFEA
jgi:benzoylformate decarboxylase